MRTDQRTWDLEADVVVVGFGDAGSAAALEALAAGAEVVVLEKAPEEHAGGNSRVSGQIWFKNDDVERSKVYLRSLCGDRPIPEAIVEVWATETAANTAWIEALGGQHMLMDYHREPEFPELEGSDCYGGYLHLEPTWGHSRLYQLLSSAAKERGARVLYATPAARLAVDDDGSVVGVEAQSADGPLGIRARRAVVLTSGGFEANAEMIRDHLGLPATGVPWGSPHNTGDGHRMAQKIGAGLWHMGNYAPSLGLRAPGHDAGFPVSFARTPRGPWSGHLSDRDDANDSATVSGGYVFVGLDGLRFANETLRTGHGHGLVHGQYELFPRAPMYVVFDDRARRAGPLAPTIDAWPHGWNQIVEGYRWSDDNAAELEKGWFVSAETVEELAAAMDVPPARLTETIEEWNAACGAGKDDLGRDPSTLVPIDQPPYYAFYTGPNMLYTCGGPRRNERAQVLDAFGEVIPRLYCAGELSSTYSGCMDGGMMIADALAFGRVAGRNAAAEQPPS